MSDMTAEKLGQRITDAGLLDSRQLEAVWGELGTREVTLDQFTSLLTAVIPQIAPTTAG
jgi:serine/threonine-protein kinase